MEQIDNFLEELASQNGPNELLNFCQSKILHRQPAVFDGNKDGHFAFCKRIGERFEIDHRDVMIVGSAQLGFSVWKRKVFDFNSDIDVAIVSDKLFEKIMDTVCEFQMQIRANRRAVTIIEMQKYHEFLEYIAMGWIRPDKLPVSSPIGLLKKNWFDFFNSISHGRSEAGNYKVSAGVFRSHRHLERYQVSMLRLIQSRFELEN